MFGRFVSSLFSSTVSSVFRPERFLQKFSPNFCCHSNFLRQFSFTAQNHYDDILMRDIRRGSPPKHARKPHDRKPIKGTAFRKGIVIKVVVKHPKKPNSGNRQCVLVRLSTGRQCIAYIPGEGHNLQEHSQIYVRGGRRRDLIGVRANVMRGKLDCAAVKKK
ncbi:hypothetical protein niasHS_010681 [Heterodera schachtii]|uniref:Small ribosomal subunit protein uS12m n=1 Tax=Heterodera schachtii TaxID=97005 RepID=A0ABD2IS97_HETSC